MPKLKDLTGSKIGSWTILSTFRRGVSTFCRARCDCGREYDVRAYHIKDGASKSCVHCGKITHNMSKAPLYAIWERICVSPHGCCQEWRTFVNFQVWAEEQGWSKGLWLHRRGDTGQYEPANCYIAASNERARGGKSRYAKLLPEDIPEIFKLQQDGKYHWEIAEAFGCSRVLITNVLNGKIWSK